jgi:uncharacterized membrane protein
VAWRSLGDRSNRRRVTTAAFWGVLAVVFLCGDWLPPALVGALVLALAVLAGTGGVTRGTQESVSPATQEATAFRLGNLLFMPILVIPVVTVALVYALKFVTISGVSIDQQQRTVIALAVACVPALAWACRLTGDGPARSLDSARGLLGAVGWAAILPLVLAALGGVFAASGVGDIVADLVSKVLPTDSRLACVLAYSLGMALFTMVMGNAFAAFPVMTAGLGLPLLVHQHGADAAAMAAIGMLSGYCGTLLTPMAANFNIVPAALLELRDKHAVIRAQAPTAVVLLATNVLLMYLLIFR